MSTTTPAATIEEAADRMAAVWENETPRHWSPDEMLAYVLTGTSDGLDHAAGTDRIGVPA